MVVQELRSKVSVVLGHRHDTARVLDGSGSLDQAAYTVDLVTLDCRVTRLGRGWYGMVWYLATRWPRGRQIGRRQLTYYRFVYYLTI